MHQKIETTPKKLIIWEKWYDPFGRNLAADEFPGALDGPSHLDKYDNDNDDEYDDHYEDFEDYAISPDILQKEHINHLKHSLNKKNQPVQLLQTPMGMIPLTENTMAGDIFNFWTGYTNFPLTTHIKDIIDETDGVETLDIYTRYRFRIAVGKAFDAQIVKYNIGERINASK